MARKLCMLFGKAAESITDVLRIRTGRLSRLPRNEDNSRELAVNPSVELRLLRYVVAVAEELHFSRAALRVRVAQPSLSKQIRDLEEGLGVSLFNRSNRTEQITQAGRDFVKEAVKALLYADRAVEAAKQAENAENGLLSVGYTPRINLRVVSAVRALSANKRWGLKLAFISSETHHQVQSLLQ